VTPESLVEKGLLKNTKIDVKLLGTGEISTKLTIRVHAISATAREKIEKAGGTIELLREPTVRKVKTHTAKPVAAEEPDATDEAAKEETPADEAPPEPEG
jgi:large subunit ribosomal protein L15